MSRRLFSTLNSALRQKKRPRRPNVAINPEVAEDLARQRTYLRDVRSGFKLIIAGFALELCTAEDGLFASEASPYSPPLPSSNETLEAAPFDLPSPSNETSTILQAPSKTEGAPNEINDKRIPAAILMSMGVVVLLVAPRRWLRRRDLLREGKPRADLTLISPVPRHILYSFLGSVVAVDGAFKIFEGIPFQSPPWLRRGDGAWKLFGW